MDASALPDLPHATVFTPEGEGEPLSIEADLLERHGDIYNLASTTPGGEPVITFRDHTVRADRMTYDTATGQITLDGHVLISGGANAEYLQAARGTYNLNTETGKFYEVSGSVGLHGAKKRPTYESTNPFLFSGRLVIKTGPVNYDIYDGKVTSCLMTNPDWQLSAGHFSLDGDKARAYNSTFHLLKAPVLYLPYVTHPIDSEERQSGILTPVIEPHSSTKGTIIGEEVYLALGRSADLTLGLQYFSARGYSESGTYRYRGVGNDFATAHFTALQDRGYIAPSGVLTNQGGQDVTLAFRRKFTSKTRVVGDAEYLSSYVYREAFNENFNQAVSSDITSVLYAVNQQYGFSTAVRADRYQGLKRVPLTNVNKTTGAVTTAAGQEVRIFHAPSLDFTALDHHLGKTPLVWSVDSSIAGLHRSQPNFTSSGIIERLDLRPELSLPLAGGGWHTMTSVAVRETFYSRSRLAPYPPNQSPQELLAPLNRASLEFQSDVRLPAIERTFATPAFVAKLLGPELRHTVEPQLVYRNTSGIGNFLGVLRFDDIDIDSNTNELEYGVTQRLFSSRRAAKPTKLALSCPADSRDAVAAATAPAAALDPSTGNTADAPSPLDANGIPTPEAAPAPNRSHARDAAGLPCAPAEPQQQEWLSWKLTQKHFFDPYFGGAVIPSRRNIFNTTLDLSGIAFLTEARDISPVVSKLRMRTTSHTDLEWDFDLDTGAKTFTRSNVFVDAHEGPFFGGVSYARLNAPGRSYHETIDANGANSVTPSAVSDFSQLRLLVGYGNTSKAGLSLAANANLDLGSATTGSSLQYGALQANYNWNCCGFSVEYRKYELGSVRNEGTERFSFTLVNIGTAGNLRKSQRLF